MLPEFVALTESDEPIPQFLWYQNEMRLGDSAFFTLELFDPQGAGRVFEGLAHFDAVNGALVEEHLAAAWRSYVDASVCCR